MHPNNRRRIVGHHPNHEPISETVKRVIEDLSKRTGEPELKTGLEPLDRGTFGLHPAQLTVLAARPGMGKTSAACQIAFNLADAGKKVAFISLEITRENLVEKLFCLTARVNSRKLMTNTLTPDEKFKLDSFAILCKDLPIKIIDDYCFSEDELFTLMEHEDLRLRPQVLILDHLQHIRNEDANTERATMNNYLRYLKEIAMKFKIAVLVLSQINRQGDEKPTIANLKGTGAIEEIADAVIILHQKTEKTEFSQQDELIECVMDVAKNRRGPTGYFDILFEAHTGRFLSQSYRDKEMEKPEREIYP